MPTITEIANHAGVSRTAVWLTLNQKSGVSDAMRQRVLIARDKLESHAGEFNNHRERKSLPILVLHSALVMSTEYFKRLLNGIQVAADRFQIQLRLVAIEPEMPPEHVANLYFSDSDLHPAGVISLGSSAQNHIQAKAKQINVPFVQVGVPHQTDYVSFVAPNEVEAGYEATCYLLEQGHQAIGVIGHQLGTAHLQNRLTGYGKALVAAGIPHQDDWLFLTGGNHTSYAEEVRLIEEVVSRFLQEKPRVTAIMFTNWQSSVTGLPMIVDAGYRIPQDLSVLVFDNFDHAATFDPPLTAVDYPLEQMGFGAVKMLIEQINEPLLEDGQYMYRTRLIERESCMGPMPKEVV